jgi:hypothetical protein
MQEKKEPRYYLRKWEEVTEKEYVDAERAEGFHNTLGQPDKPATSSFSGKTYEGRQGFLHDHAGHSSVIDHGHHA